MFILDAIEKYLPIPEVTGPKTSWVISPANEIYKVIFPYCSVETEFVTSLTKKKDPTREKNWETNTQNPSKKYFFIVFFTNSIFNYINLFKLYQSKTILSPSSNLNKGV